jgi:hypothetical protein
VRRHQEAIEFIEFLVAKQGVVGHGNDRWWVSAQCNKTTMQR